MTQKVKTVADKLFPVVFIVLLLGIWQLVSELGAVPRFMLPSPSDVFLAFASEFKELMQNAATTLTEAFAGLGISVAFSFGIAFVMDRFRLLHRAFYPILVLTQTVPTVAIAPLLVLWMGYDMAPKITLVMIVCFFPMTVGLLDGFRAADEDTLSLLRAMGAGRGQIFRYVKLPGALGHFFAGLRVSVSFSVVGAVIAEWLGGLSGLGVYMTRVRKSYSYDKMFAVIFLISVISLLLMYAVTLLQRLCMPWQQKSEKAGGRLR